MKCKFPLCLLIGPFFWRRCVTILSIPFHPLSILLYLLGFCKLQLFLIRWFEMLLFWRINALFYSFLCANWCQHFIPKNLVLPKLKLLWQSVSKRCKLDFLCRKVKGWLMIRLIHGIVCHIFENATHRKCWGIFVSPRCFVLCL